MHPKSRRDFLELAATSFATMVCVRGLPSRAELASPGHSVRGWLTAGSRRFQEISLSGWQAPTGSASSAGVAPIEVNPSQTFQSILGFGGAFTDSSCFLFNQMRPDARHQLLQALFSPAGLNLSHSITPMADAKLDSFMSVINSLPRAGTTTRSAWGSTIYLVISNLLTPKVRAASI